MLVLRRKCQLRFALSLRCGSDGWVEIGWPIGLTWTELEHDLAIDSCAATKTKNREKGGNSDASGVCATKAMIGLYPDPPVSVLGPCGRHAKSKVEAEHSRSAVSKYLSTNLGMLT